MLCDRGVVGSYLSGIEVIVVGGRKPALERYLQIRRFVVARKGEPEGCRWGECFAGIVLGFSISGWAVVWDEGNRQIHCGDYWGKGAWGRFSSQGQFWAGMGSPRALFWGEKTMENYRAKVSKTGSEIGTKNGALGQKWVLGWEERGMAEK